jgi:PKD repeat protein
VTDKRYAVLSWTSPKDCTSVKGSITGYTVKLMGLSPWVNMTQLMPTVQGSEGNPCARCENLIPYTNYSASVYIMRSNVINSALPYTVNFTTLSDGEWQNLKQRMVINNVQVFITLHIQGGKVITMCVM